MSKEKSQQSLDNWTKQDWGTKSGKPSAKTGERYLPKKAIAALSDSEYKATSDKKRKDTAAGKQHSPQTKKARRVARQFRNIGGPVGVTQAPPEFLQEIGEYSKAEPYNPLAEKLQKDFDKSKKIKDVAMMVASPIKSIKKAKKIQKGVYEYRGHIIEDMGGYWNWGVLPKKAKHWTDAEYEDASNNLKDAKNSIDYIIEKVGENYYKG